MLTPIVEGGLGLQPVDQRDVGPGGGGHPAEVIGALDDAHVVTA